MTTILGNAAPAVPWKRLVAFLIDLPVLLILGWISRALFDQFIGVEYLVCWAYFALMESSSLQASLGKKTLGLKVVDLQGNRAGLGRVSGRYWAKLISVVSLGAGFALVFFTDNRQAFHDYVSGCLVLDERAFPAARAESIPPTSTDS
jgi:uncharacterized RDD family membrane protein YckC